jgi:hypothetical protein
MLAFANVGSGLMGRRRKSGPRTKSGRLSRAHATAARDHGTAEGQRNRHHLVNGAAVELAGSALTVLLANGHIDAEQARAAGAYHAVYALSFGLPVPKGSQRLFEPHAPRIRSDRSLARARERFEAMARRLGRDQKAALDQLVVIGALPTWFRQVKLGRPLRPEDEAEREALISGLEKLAE